MDLCFKKDAIFWENDRRWLSEAFKPNHSLKIKNALWRTIAKIEMLWMKIIENVF